MIVLREWATYMERVPGLSQVPEDVRRRFEASSKHIILPAAARLLDNGQAPANFLLLVKGAIRVQLAAPNGREIVLYRISAGEICVPSTTGVAAGESYHVEWIAETVIEVLAIPWTIFQELVSNSSLFRQFLIKSFSTRIEGLFRTVGEIAFSRLDIRLAQQLLQLKNASGKIEVTHQQLAAELGSVREVITRKLHHFQRHGWIKSSRGTITVIQEAALRDLAEEIVLPPVTKALA